MFSFVEDTVLDPFLGSGTVSLATRNLDRNSVGYELNPDFIDVIKNKLEVDKNKISDNANIRFIEQGNIKTNFKEKISKLPYIFEDPFMFDKKVDIKKITVWFKGR